MLYRAIHLLHQWLEPVHFSIFQHNKFSVDEQSRLEFSTGRLSGICGTVIDLKFYSNQRNGISSILRLFLSPIEHCRDRFVDEKSELISIVLCRERNAYRINNRAALNTNSLNPWPDQMSRSKEKKWFFSFTSLLSEHVQDKSRTDLPCLRSNRYHHRHDFAPRSVSLRREIETIFLSSFMSLDKTADNNRLLYSI